MPPCVTKVTEIVVPLSLICGSQTSIHVAMRIIPVQSYSELISELPETGRSFLLLYKKGSEQSDCALQRINGISGEQAFTIFTADVNRVRDIHARFQVTTAPSLVVINQGKVANVIKGCQTEASYESLFMGREMGYVVTGDAKPRKNVTVYTTPTCTWCTTLKTYLNENRIQYREVNVAADSGAAEAMVRKSGQQGVPQTEINGQMIVGFDRNRINQLLDIT